MQRNVPCVVLAAVTLGFLAAAPTAQAPNPPAPSSSQDRFAREIQPIFAKSCWNCHGPDAQLADLDLSTREAAIRGGEHGAAIVPGNAEQSRLYRMVAGLESISDADGRLAADAGGNRGHQRVDRRRCRVGRNACGCRVETRRRLERAGCAREHGHHARAAGLLGVQAAGAGAGAAGSRCLSIPSIDFSRARVRTRA